jgi:1,4-alpha-glucan branching enzyme
MKQLGMLVFLLAGLCYAQVSEDFQPAETNVWGSEYPRVDGAGRVQIRVKAPDATKVKVNFWSGPKVDMVKQPDGYWTVTTPSLVPGLHYYTLIIDGAPRPGPRDLVSLEGDRQLAARTCLYTAEVR